VSSLGCDDLPVTPSRADRTRATATLRIPPHRERAAEHLRFIRDTMERAGAFTAVSGRGQIIVGAIGLVASVVASRQENAALWLATCVAAAVAGALVAALAIRRKATRLGIRLFSGPARRFMLTFTTPLVAGAILTVVLYHAGMIQRLPGTWLLLFGTGVVTGGATSVDAVPVMGACFMVMAVAAFALPAAWGDVLMGAGFGLLNLAFGAIIAVKHGG
jgi:hypothetical protein